MTDLVAILQEFHQDKLAMYLRHQAGARLESQYEANNTYQYIINREEMQLSWLEGAIADLGATVTERVEAGRPGLARDADAARTVLAEDASDAQAFVDRWQPRVEAMSNARHRGMLRVVLGETLEHKRFFEQALAGRVDLLGRRGAEVGPSQGKVLATRWIE